MNNTEEPFVADVDPDFLSLRASLRDDIRTAEAGFRKDMEEMRVQLPPDLAAHLHPIVTGCPARFIRGLLPFFAGLSTMLDTFEEVGEQLEQHRRSIQ